MEALQHAQNLLNELQDIEERIVLKRDNFRFVRDVLGYQDAVERIHRPVIEKAMGPKPVGGKGKVWLLPRGTFKTSVITIGAVAKKIADNPNIRVLIANEIYDNAEKFVGEIKQHFERNEKFRSLYGDFVSGAPMWNKNEFIVNRREIIRKEPTVMCVGVGGTRVGMHVDLIVCDDLVSKNNIQTPDQLNKVIDFFKYLLSILEPDGEVWIIGTRWHFEDLYGWLIEAEEKRQESGQPPQFDISIEAAEGSDGTLYFPERLTREFLNSQLEVQGEEIYHCQYLNQPLSKKNQVFKMDDFEYYPDNVELPERSKLRIYIMCDPARTKKKTSDDTAIGVIGVHQNKWYVLDGIVDKLATSEIVSSLMDMVKKWWPVMKIGIEDEGYNENLKVPLKTEMYHSGKFVLIESLKTKNVSKRDRIRGLEPRIKAGGIVLPETIRRWSDFYSKHVCFVKCLLDQFVFFPKYRRDDIADMLAYGNQLIPIEVVGSAQSFKIKQKMRERTNPYTPN